MSTTELAELIDSKFRELREGSIVTGTIQEIRPQVVLVDIGYKSEGAISISEFEDEEIEVGDQIEVLLERLENDEGIVVLSKERPPISRTGIRSWACTAMAAWLRVK